MDEPVHVPDEQHPPVSSGTEGVPLVHDPEQDDFVDGVQKVEGVFLTSTKTLEGTGEDPATEISNQHAQAEKKAQAIFPRHSDFEDSYFVARNASAYKARADGFAFLSL